MNSGSKKRLYVIMDFKNCQRGDNIRGKLMVCALLWPDSLCGRFKTAATVRAKPRSDLAFFLSILKYLCFRTAYIFFQTCILKALRYIAKPWFVYNQNFCHSLTFFLFYEHFIAFSRVFLLFCCVDFEVMLLETDYFTVLGNSMLLM